MINSRGNKQYVIEHDHGVTHLYAYSEQDAIEQFRSRYPSYRIIRVRQK